MLNVYLDPRLPALLAQTQACGHTVTYAVFFSTIRPLIPAMSIPHATVHPNNRIHLPPSISIITVFPNF